jgi:hypothetical protein
MPVNITRESTHFAYESFLFKVTAPSLNLVIRPVDTGESDEEYDTEHYYFLLF